MRYSGTLPPLNLPAATDFTDHCLGDCLPEFRIPDGGEALFHHLPIPGGKLLHDEIRGEPVRNGGAAFRDFSYGEKQPPKFILAGQFVEFGQDFLFEKLQLMEPGRSGGQHVQGAPPEVFGKGARCDLGANGAFPQIHKTMVGPFMGNVHFFENLMKDIPQRFRFLG